MGEDLTITKYELATLPQVDLTEVEERQWLDKAYAPLLNFLTQEMPVLKEEIISAVMYMGSSGRSGNDKFYYKNTITRSYIVFDQTGRVVEQAKDALFFL